MNNIYEGEVAKGVIHGIVFTDGLAPFGACWLICRFSTMVGKLKALYYYNDRTLSHTI